MQAPGSHASGGFVVGAEGPRRGDLETESEQRQGPGGGQGRARRCAEVTPQVWWCRLVAHPVRDHAPHAAPRGGTVARAARDEMDVRVEDGLPCGFTAVHPYVEADDTGIA